MLLLLLLLPTRSDAKDSVGSLVPSSFPVLTIRNATATKAPAFLESSVVPSLEPSESSVIPSLEPSESSVIQSLEPSKILTSAPTTMEPSSVPTKKTSVSPGPTATPSDYLHPLETLLQGNNVMNINPNSPLNPASEKIWEEITAQQIYDEIIKNGKLENVETLEVIVTLSSQEPRFITSKPSMSPSFEPSAMSPTFEPSEISSSFKPSAISPSSSTMSPSSLWSAIIVVFNGRRDQVDVERNIPDDMSDDARYLQTGNLNILFSVTINIRSRSSGKKILVINDYINGAFDTALDRQRYLATLKKRDPAFTDAQRLNVVPPSNPPTAAPVMDEGLALEVIVGIVVASLALVVFAGCAMIRLRKQRAARFVTETTSLANVQGMEEESAAPRHEFSEIELEDRTNDVSTLGDPIPDHLRTSGQQSLADSFSLDYDYQQTYRDKSGRPSVADALQGDSNHSNLSGLSVAKDDDTLEEQYAAVDQFEVEAPPGMLGLILEASGDGVPTVHAIKASSPLASDIQVGDRLWSLDGEDMTVMLASDVSRLIASKRDNPIRRFVFSRPHGKGRAMQSGTIVDDYNDEYIG